MKYLAYISLFLLYLLLFVGCQKDGKHSSASTASLETSEPSGTQVEIEKRISTEAFVKTKEVELTGGGPDEETLKGESSKIAEEKSVVTVEKKKPKPTAAPKKKKTVKKKPVKKKGPKISFDSIDHHLPTITRGETFSHQFRFKNTGDAPLSILLATPSCGCTLPSFPFLDILPDSSGVIGVEYNSVGKHGKQEADITITANTIPKETIVKMIFDVLEPEEEN